MRFTLLSQVTELFNQIPFQLPRDHTADYLHTQAQELDDAGFVTTLQNGDIYLRYHSCHRYCHLLCFHPSFPDDEFGEDDIEYIRDHGILCHSC